MKNILIVGGYGSVGLEISRMLYIMKNVFKWSIFGILIGCSIFTAVGIFFDITNHGNFTLTNWSYTKMAIGAMLVGIGFSMPSIVYSNEKLHNAVKVMIQMGIGCAVMLAVAFSVGWIPVESGWKICALAVVGYLLSAFIIWLGFSCYFRREAKQINKKIQQKQNRN